MIRSDGTGEANWRTYRWCDGKVQGPCDRTEGNTIISGGRAPIRFAPEIGGTGAWLQALGIVEDTTDPDGLMKGVIVMQLMPYNMAELRQDGRNPLSLCGERYADLAPKALLATAPCGA